MKNLLLFMIMLLSLQSDISAQIISNDKNASDYFGIFGETSGNGINAITTNVNIGRDFIEASRIGTFAFPPKLRLNPNNGAAVQMGGEVNRVATTNADLLPFAYGEFYRNPNTIIEGTNNYSMNSGQDGGGFNYVDIVFDDTSINTSDLIIVATPRTGGINGPNIVSGGGEEDNRKSQKSADFVVGDASQVLIDHLDASDTGSNICRVYLYTRTGLTAQHPYFSFVAFNK